MKDKEKEALKKFPIIQVGQIFTGKYCAMCFKELDGEVGYERICEKCKNNADPEDIGYYESIERQAKA